jgi:hypothetical protein
LHGFAPCEPFAREAVSFCQDEPALVSHGEGSAGQVIFFEQIEHGAVKCFEAGQRFAGGRYGLEFRLHYGAAEKQKYGDEKKSRPGSFHVCP